MIKRKFKLLASLLAVVCISGAALTGCDSSKKTDSADASSAVEDSAKTEDTKVIEDKKDDSKDNKKDDSKETDSADDADEKGNVEEEIESEKSDDNAIYKKQSSGTTEVNIFGNAAGSADDLRTQAKNFKLEDAKKMGQGSGGKVTVTDYGSGRKGVAITFINFKGNDNLELQVTYKFDKNGDFESYNELVRDKTSDKKYKDVLKTANEQLLDTYNKVLGNGEEEKLKGNDTSYTWGNKALRLTYHEGKSLELVLKY